MPARPYRIGRSKTGLGLFATREIEKGSFIVEYKGPWLTNAEADAANDSNKYLYEVNSRWTIDGSSRSNVARYANHSCRPNAESDVVRRKTGKRKTRVIIRAIKTIKPGDEIVYDYGIDYFNLILRPMGCRCGKCPPNRRKNQGKKLNGRH